VLAEVFRRMEELLDSYAAGPRPTRVADLKVVEPQRR
jgi:hypothetical protein